MVASAQTTPLRQDGTWVVKDFRFHTGDMLPALTLHYTTLGSPANEPVLVLHGTTGSGAGLLNAAFGGELFGAGQPLDATKYFIILPDAIGHGGSSKPSDSLRTKFPRYNCNDMVDAQYRLLTEHRLHSQRPRVDERQLHAATKERAVRVGYVQLRNERRQSGALQSRADA